MSDRARQASALAALAVAMFLLGPVPPAAGTTFTPTRFDDPPPDGCNPGDCSLREAILQANLAVGADTISLAPGTYVLSASAGGVEDAGVEGDLDITGDLTIEGSGAGTTAIDGNGSATGERVLHLPSGSSAVVSLSGLWIRNGNEIGESGGGVRANPGTSLTITNVAVSGNFADNVGGGIRASGTATITNVTVSGNRANIDGGGIGGGAGEMVLNNVTVTGNTADADGNGGDGGGVANLGGKVTLRNSTVAGNADGSLGSPAPDCAGGVSSGGHSLIGDPTGCSFATAPGDLVGTAAAPIDPLLGPLASNGGFSPTRALLAGSPAIDAGGADCAAADQRGAPRSGTCDIGAYELVKCQKVVVNTVGTEGGDKLKGSGGRDGILGLGGKDTLAGKAGKDALCGGTGKDILNGGGGNDRLNGERGRDRCSGGGGRDKARGCEQEEGIP